MAWIRSNAHRTTPLKLLIFGLLLIGGHAYYVGGTGSAAEDAVKDSLVKLMVQVPAGVVATFIASRLFEVDFGTIGTIALKIAGITILAEGVGCWINIPILEVLAEVTVMLIGFFWLFELTTFQTYLLLFLNFAVLFGAYYIIDNYLDSPRSPYPRQNRPVRAHRR
ncbi:MAG: hypothetical protein ABS79_06170 [Planctomycetes bacterium SCN 63-9]|nr:MAG: hypothetical protein ABS79_06170 [Planctomycetes bacterium SCN 63-9]